MGFRGLLSFLILISLSLGVQANLVCSKLLSPVLTYDQIIDSRLAPILSELPSQPLHQRWMNSFHIWRFKRILELERLSNHGRLEQAISLSYELLKKMEKNSSKPESTVPDYIYDWTQRELLKLEISPFLQTFEARKQGALNKAMASISKTLHHPVVAFVLNPTRLPVWKDVPLSEELLRGIALNGVEQYMYKLQRMHQAYGQEARGQYRRFSRVWQVLTTSATVIFMAHALYTFPDQLNSIMVENLFENLETMEKALDELNTHLDEELKKLEEQGEI